MIWLVFCSLPRKETSQVVLEYENLSHLSVEKELLFVTVMAEKFQHNIGSSQHFVAGACVKITNITRLLCS